MTIRQFTSVVLNQLNAIREDIDIPREYIYTLSIPLSKLLLKRETDSRKIFKNTSMFKKICLPMQEVSLTSCGLNIGSCQKVMRSVDKVPEIYLSSYGNIAFLMNANKSKTYIEVTPNRYSTLRKAKFFSKETGYYWIEDSYLFVPDSEVEVLNLFGLFPEVAKIVLDENKRKNDGTCTSLLDTEMPIPPYMEAILIEQTFQQVANRLRIPVDENSNLNSNAKN